MGQAQKYGMVKSINAISPLFLMSRSPVDKYNKNTYKFVVGLHFIGQSPSGICDLWRFWFMVFYATFNNISVISWP